MSDVGSHRMLLNKTNHIFERLAIDKKACVQAFGLFFEGNAYKLTN